MNHVYILFLIISLLLQACGGFKRVEKKAQLTTSPNNLELFVNHKTNPYTIPVNYTLNIPKNYIPSCARLIYTPHLIAPEKEYAMTPIVITGKDFARQEDRKAFLRHEKPDYPNALHYLADNNNTQIQISESIPFQQWMPGAKLTASVSLEACNRQTQLYNLEVAPNVVYIPLAPGPVRVKYIPKEILQKEEGFAHFHYPVNGYVVDPAMQNNQQQLKDMIRLVQKVKLDTSLHITKIVITGICSPEGPYFYNENLARKRAGFIHQYLVDHMNIKPNLIEARYIAEDWDGLRKLIVNSTKPGISSVLSILDGPYDVNQRETLLSGSSQYNYIKQNLFPQLRKVTYEIFYTKLEKYKEVVPE